MTEGRLARAGAYRLRGTGRALLIAGLVAWCAGAAPPVFDPAQSDPRAIALADLTLQAMGGQAAWEQTRFVHFAFVVEKGGTILERRLHLWDRWRGRLRYETTDKGGTPLVVLLDVNERRGEAYRGGARLDPGAAQALLDQAYEAWINDTYWLFMPYKMKDPGVHLQYAGEVSEGGQVYDQVLLTFDRVGLTPGDRYWAHLSRRTHLMDRWSYILQDDPPHGAPTVWDWKGWSRFGAILLSPEKVSVRKEGTVQILHPVLEVLSSVPDGYFTDPAPVPERIGGALPGLAVGPSPGAASLQMTPSRRPTSANAPSATSRSSRACVAMTMVRTRDFSSATIG